MECQQKLFAMQPFALCWIAGSNARGDEVASLFTLRAGVPHSLREAMPRIKTETA